MKCLILGADGFLGSHLVDSLYCKGDEIRAFDLFRDGKSNNLEHLRNKIEFFPGNFLNQNDITNAVKGIDIVYHFISLTTPASSIQDPFIDIDTNIRGTIDLFDKCVKAGVKRIIFSSSGGTIYGNNKKNKISEKTITLPTSPYGISKLTIERYLEYFKINFGIDYLILRYANPYGPRQNISGSQGIIPIFLNKIKNNKPITIYGDGYNIRDYIYISDAINLTIKLLSKKNTKYNLYNIGSGTGVSINELMKIIEQVADKKFIINKAPNRACDVPRVILDNRRLLKEISENKLTTLKKGIKLTWDSLFY